MTPSLFKGIKARDEYSFMLESGAAKKIEKHRKTFITEEDFRWLSNNGVNAVRIPVGYWILDGDKPFVGCISYLDWAMEMAEKYDLAVLIDLHAVKGSQNGKHHSGKIGQSEWFGRRDYRRDTIKTLERLARRYKDSPALWGVEIINEPSLGPMRYFTLLRFYREAYKVLASALRPGTRVVFSDGFVPWLLSGALLNKNRNPPVMAVHWYQFGKVDIERYFASLVRRPRYIEWWQRQQQVIIGEWSGVISHETVASLAKGEQAKFEKQNIEHQLAAYSAAEGWFYWTYKTESTGVWNFRKQVEKGNLLLR